MIPEDFTPLAQGQASAAIRKFDIDLSVARDSVEFRTPGYSFLSVAAEAFTAGRIDFSKQVGVALAAPVSSVQTQLLLRAGANFKLPPSENLYLTHDAQPNSMLRIYLSTYPFMDTSSNIVNSIREYASPVGQNFVTFGGGGAGDMTLFTPAQNPRGAIIRTCMMNSTGNNVTLLQMSQTAPGGYVDNTKATILASVGQMVNLPYPVFVPAGYGLYLRRYNGGGADQLNATWDFK